MTSVVWVHRYGEAMASYRYRAKIPCEEVGKIPGFTTAINNGDADIVVFSKPSAEEIPQMLQAKSEGAKVVVDLSDDHFNLNDTYNRLAELADGIVCASDVMRGRIYDYVKRDSVAIPDPYEQEECEPHADGDQLIWFGHISNLPDLNMIAPFIADRKILVATGPIAPNNQPVIWGPEALGRALASANIALLPTRKGAENKSPNRLLNVIRAGLFPVCMEHPAYEEFKNLVWVGNFPTGMRWVDAFRGDLNGLVKEAQDYIRDRYSPKTIGEKWAQYLKSL